MLNEVLVGYLELFLETEFVELSASSAGGIISELRSDNQLCLGSPWFAIIELTIEIDPPWYGVLTVF